MPRIIKLYFNSRAALALTLTLALTGFMLVLPDRFGGLLETASAQTGNQDPNSQGGSEQTTSASGCATPTFHPAPIYQVGQEPRSAAVGDFNNDGKPDIVTGNYGANSVSVLLNDGTGAFSVATNFTVGAGPQSVAVGDFNGDGKLDLVTANNSAFSISLLLGDGEGNFGPASDFGINLQPLHVAVGDFNRDGKPDLAVGGNGLAILLGDGAGGFAPPTRISIGASFIAIADFNGDGKSDLAIASSPNIQILLGDGAGGFTRITTTGCANAPASKLAVGDFNGDGKPDLAASWSLNGQISVLFGDGGGCFGTVKTLNASSNGAGYHGISVLVSDFNGDGKADILTGTDDAGVSIIQGDGAGNFGAPISFGFTDGSYPVALSDFNVDGKPDALTITSFNSVSVLFGGGANNFTYVLNGAFSLVAGDFNRDGRVDLAATGAGLQILLGDGAGGFESARSFKTSSTVVPVAAGDFNSDGKLDLVVVSPTSTSSVFILLGDGAGGFQSPTSSSSVSSDPFSVAVGDLNKDGKLDVVTVHQSFGNINVLLGDGTGGLGPAVSYQAQAAVNSGPAGIGDFNGDGNPDLAVPSLGMTILLGDGKGGFGPIIMAAPGFASEDLIVRDFNGDGKLDIVFSNANTGEVMVILGDGAGHFSAPRSFSAGGRSHRVTSADFNGDGLPDIASGNSTSNSNGQGLSSVSVLFNDGAGGFLPASTYFTAGSNSLVAADFSGDGRADLMAANSAGYLSPLLNTCGIAPGVSGTTLQFAASNFDVSENAGGVNVTVTRAGDTSGESSVEYQTADGTALQKSDYTLAAGVLRFAPGETTKSFRIFIVNDLNVNEAGESLRVTLRNPTGAVIGRPGTATVTISDDDSTFPSSNPIDNAQVFVRQHYLDFLNREPDSGGLDYWSSEISKCGSDQQCIRDRRIGVSDAFFFEPEFQQTGAYVYRVFKAALGQMPSYSQFMPERGRVVAGSLLEESKRAYALSFVKRNDFLTLYPRTLSADQFVGALISSLKEKSGVDLTSRRDTFVSLYDGTDAGRANILSQVAEDATYIDAEYNNSFTLMLYFGYLRRDPEPGGFNFWRSQLDKYALRNVDIQHAMVCSFITSAEYQTRFSSVVTHTNRECPQ